MPWCCQLRNRTREEEKAAGLWPAWMRALLPECATIPFPLSGHSDG